jgi:ubiquinone biosynthesis protein
MASAMTQIKRYAEITNVFIKYGFRDIIRQLRIETQDSFTKKILEQDQNESTDPEGRWIRLRLALEELGPTFIKLGQLISNRPDQFPEDLIREMENLQDSVPPFSFDDVKKIIEEDLGLDIQSVFTVFEKEPSGAGSIAQVHKAIMQTGQDVVVKVQRPGIVEKILTDIEILLSIANLMEKYMPEMKTIRPVELIRNFEKSIKEELDFKNEALNIRRFQNNFKDNHDIFVPNPFKAYTTHRILVMGMIQGTKISETEKLNQLNVNPEQLADKISDLFFKQFFEYGFFHADPHPGNVVILPDEKVCFLDFGMMGTIHARDRELLSSVFIGIQRNDVNRIIRALKKLAMNNDVREGRKLQYQVQDLIDQYAYMALGEVKLGNILMKLKALLIENNIQVPADLFLLIRAMAITEGIVTRLVPDYDLIKKMEPFVEKIIKERFMPEHLFEELKFSAYDSLSFLKKLPSELEDIFYSLKKGKMHIEFEHKGLEGLINKMDIVSNRLVFAIILASLVIGSSIIVHAHVPPMFNGVPLIGIIGYLLASIIGLVLIINILRHGKLK